mgnify:CR=1 FL=1
MQNTTNPPGGELFELVSNVTRTHEHQSNDYLHDNLSVVCLKFGAVDAVFFVLDFRFYTPNPHWIEFKKYHVGNKLC